MAKKRIRLEDDIATVFDHWAISPKAKENLVKQFRKEDDLGESRESSAEPEQLVPPAAEATPTQPPPTETPEESRPSKSDPQKQRVKNRGSKSDSLKRTFQSRPSGDAKGDRANLVDNIPKRHFFSYYNALHDQVLPQVPKNGRLLLSVLFRHSHGFNRNWCRISFPELARIAGSTSNTLRESLKGLIEGGWVAIASDGFHEATTYVLRIQAEIKEGGEDDFDPQNLTLKNRPSKIDPQKLTQSPSDFDPQKLRPITSSTCTGHLTGQKPDLHRSEIEHGSVETERIVPGGENQVRGNLVLKKLPSPEPHPRALSSKLPSAGLSEIESAYVYSLPSQEQREIFDAQDAWDDLLGQESRPSASKLNEMLDYLRHIGYGGDVLIEKLRGCLEKTKGRASDPVGWMISALKKGRYP